MDEHGDYRLDFSLLNRYILPRLKIKTIAEGQTTFITSSFRQCQIEDFTRVGYKPHQDDHASYLSRICPEFDTIAQKSIAEHFIIKNGYVNNVDRISFSVEIDLCNENVEYGMHNEEI